MNLLHRLKDYRFTAWIMLAFAAGMLFPQSFQYWGELDLRNKWLLLVIIQVVMFGMGIQMKLKDFTHLGSTGKGVAVGLLSQFTIMPIVGFILSRIANLPPEVAAGIVLIGCCSSGLASNVMVYIAKANLFLSVVLTAIATLAAPFITPLLMKLLAGTLVHISITTMMFDILKIVIVPVGAALLHDYLKSASKPQQRKVFWIAGIAATWLFALTIGAGQWLTNRYTDSRFQQSIELFSILCGGYLVGIGYHFLTLKFTKLDAWMPTLSMAGIIYITLVTTAAGRDNLLLAGWVLLACAIIHNVAGFALGYGFSRLLGLNKTDARTISLEVGLQNGAMASGLAGSMGKIGTMGLAAAVFIPWMNITGSLLANYWKMRPITEKQTAITTSKNRQPETV